MIELSNTFLWCSLGVTVILSGFFAGSETGMMSLNRYQLRHLARINKRARHVLKLLERPDRLLGVILIANTLVNIATSAIATLLSIRLFGEEEALFISVSLTFLVLIFAEVAPKTLAALHPMKVAFPSSILLSGLLTVFYPLVFLTNLLSNGILRLFGISVKHTQHESISSDELKHLVHESGHHLAAQHRMMLLSILDLEKTAVEDIMIHRSTIAGIDLSAPWNRIVDLIRTSPHSILPVYRQDIDNIIGLLHIRKALNQLAQGLLSTHSLMAHLEKPYFIPCTTPLNVQLLQFQQNHHHLALVVNEYGDIIGLITLADLLEEIVGEFTPHSTECRTVLHPQKNGSYQIEGSMLIRDLNRALNWQLPSLEAKTLSGAIITQLENIPTHPICLSLGEYRIEILEIKDNRITLAAVYPPSSIT